MEEHALSQSKIFFFYFKRKSTTVCSTYVVDFHTDNVALSVT